MATAAEPQPASLPLPGGRKGASVKLHPLLTGTVIAPPAYVYRETGRLGPLRALGIGVPRDRWLKLAVPAFLVEHPGVGNVLVDTGFHPSVGVDPKQNLGRLAATLFPKPETEASQAVPAQLRARGIEPSSVKVVVMTHLHFDHASGMSEFPDATFVFSTSEWEAATASRAQMNGYVARQFDHGFDYRLLDFESEEADSFATFGRSLDLFGDGSVRTVFTPGHTHGHMSVILKLRGREVLLAGDAIYTLRALREGALPYLMADSHHYRRSLKEIQLYERETPDTLVVASHDLDAWQKLEPVYE